jgi:CubicO group peptidase (beta-lactamase class C family)
VTESVDFPRSTPEAAGIASAAILAFVEVAEREVHDIHSFVLLRHGHLVAEGWWEPYGPAIPHLLYSLSKSFTSTAIGLLAAEGRLTVEDPVLAYFPDQAPATPSANLRAMRIRDLLTMTSGHAEDTTDRLRQDWVRDFLALPVQHAPGTYFVYNSGATYMLSAIVQRLTGMRMVEYLRPRLFEPLGIANPTWETSPQGIDLGGMGLSLTTRAIARFGQLYLQKGRWQGVQLVPAAWIEEATAYQADNRREGAAPDWSQGYGYQFWRCRHGAYRGDGAFGQFCLVMPDQDAVLAITAGTADMQHVLDLVWEHLLPAMHSDPLPEDRVAEAALAERLAALCLPPPHGQATSPTAAQVSGRTFRIAPNEDRIDALAFEFGENGSVLTLRAGDDEQRIACAHGTWRQSTAAFPHTDHWVRHSPRHMLGQSWSPARSWQVAAADAWIDARTYVIQLWWPETPYGRMLACRFQGNQLTVEQNATVSFGPTERPRLKGRLVEAEQPR